MKGIADKICTFPCALFCYFCWVNVICMYYRKQTDKEGIEVGEKYTGNETLMLICVYVIRKENFLFSKSYHLSDKFWVTIHGSFSKNSGTKIYIHENS